MTVIDFIIIGVLLFFTLRGLFKGFLPELFGLLAQAAGIFSAMHYYSLATGYFAHLFPPGPSRDAAGFSAVFVVVWLAVKIIGWVLNKNLGDGETNPISRIAGGALALAKILLFISIMVYMAESAFPNNKFTGPNKTTPICLEIAHWIKNVIPLPALPD